MSKAEFDPTDDVDRIADDLRRKVAEIVMDVRAAALKEGVGHAPFAIAVMAGLMTATVGTLMALMEPEGHEGLMQALEDYLPQARENAEDIIRNQPQ